MSSCPYNTSKFPSQGFLHLGLPAGTDSRMVAYITPNEGIMNDMFGSPVTMYFNIVGHAQAGTLGVTLKLTCEQAGSLLGRHNLVTCWITL